MKEYNLDIEGCAQLIKDQRKRLKLNQTAFGDLIGYKKAGVSKLESGKYNITVTTLYNILEKLNVKTELEMVLN